MRFTLRFLVLLLLAVNFSCGGGGGSSPPATNEGQSATGGGGPVGTLPASVRLNLRVPGTIPGAQQVANQPVPFWLALLASPAYAQTTFFTIPGARVDALGRTFAIADASGAALFRSLPPGPYRFVVTSPSPGVVLQTLLSAGPGAVLEAQVDEWTTMATLTAITGARNLGTSPDGCDLRALASLYEANSNNDFSTVRAQVLAALASGQDWLDQDFYPLSGVLQNDLQAANSSVTYRLTQSPVPGGTTIGGPLYLIVTFNQAVDPATLPPQVNGWSLETPVGTINSSNLAQFGSAGYTSQLLTMDGRAFPPNTLFFRLPNVQLAQGVTHHFGLSLPSLPTSAAGPTVLSSTPAGSFVSWDFSTNPGGGSAVESNVGGQITITASSCAGSTNANLGPLGAPVLLLGDLAPDLLGLEYYTRPQPATIPFQERVVFLRVRDADSIQLGDVFMVSPNPDQQPGFSLGYEERDYTDPNSGPTSSRRWSANSGTLTVIGLSGATIRLEGQVQMAASSGGASGTFCLDGDFQIVFP